MPGKHGTDLSQAGFTRGQLALAEQSALMQTFGADGLITEVLGVIGDGKEATVYAVRTAPHTGVERAIAKVYRAQRFRAFANSELYDAGQNRGDARSNRAMRNKTRKGRLMAHHDWIGREWENLCLLFDAGADVPEPYERSADAILMEHIGTPDAVAPLLQHVRLSAEEAEAALNALLQNIERFLRCDLIHGDLSAYNVLFDRGRVCVIDLPQAVDARTSPHARRLLFRDVKNICRGFARMKLDVDAERIATDLWQRYTRGNLS
ncbi:MAG: phosphotransferase [bacterium]|nr:phosphotransferase [bacterium]